MSTKNEFTAEEAAEKFGCTKSRICQLCRWHNIGTKWGRAWRLTRGDIRKLSKVLTFKGKNLQKIA